MKSGGGRQNSETGREYAYRTLYDGIMTLRYEPGMILNETELGKTLEIGRTPIREAILSLAESKLVTVYPQKYSCVSRINLDAVEEGLFLRYHAECGILKEAVEKANAEDLSAMRANLKEQREALEQNDLDRYMHLDNSFHRLLYLAAGKPWTWSCVMRIVTHHDRLRWLHVHMGAEKLWPGHEEHRQIFDALMTRSSRPMQDFLYSHLSAGYRSALPELIREYPDYFDL